MTYLDFRPIGQLQKSCTSAFVRLRRTSSVIPYSRMSCASRSTPAAISSSGRWQYMPDPSSATWKQPVELKKNCGFESFPDTATEGYREAQSYFRAAWVASALSHSPCLARGILRAFPSGSFAYFRKPCKWPSVEALTPSPRGSVPWKIMICSAPDANSRAPLPGTCLQTSPRFSSKTDALCVVIQSSPAFSLKPSSMSNGLQSILIFLLTVVFLASSQKE
mmetsp:Transcript_40248/g.119300  ORF Transcript_40248/g.119300 Transcript_40248/m.119300 type:complete len:221 (+) Transcript_40248:678-1340(+)